MDEDLFYQGKFQKEIAYIFFPEPTPDYDQDQKSFADPNKGRSGDNQRQQMAWQQHRVSQSTLRQNSQKKFQSRVKDKREVIETYLLNQKVSKIYF